MLKLKHNPILILMSILMLVLFCIHKFYNPLSWYYFVIPNLLYFFLLGFTSMNMKYNFYLQSTISGNTNDKKIALTFDDGPDLNFTPKVIEILKQYKAPATFFVIGKKIPKQESILKQLDNQGHLIANHSFSHSVALDFKPPSMVIKELESTNQLIQNAIGKRPMFFRPPFGVTTPFMAIALKKTNMQCIGWNNRSFDTSPFSDEILLDKIEKNLKPGGILLLHDILKRQETLLPSILELLKKESYEIVALDQLIKSPAYVS